MRSAMIAGVSAFAFVSITSGAAATPCEDLGAGTFLPAKSLAALVEQARAAGIKKDEFETTAQYQARLAKAGTSLAGSTFVVEFPLEGGFQFDADRGVVTYSKYALDGQCLIDDFQLPSEVKAKRFGSGGGYGNSAYCFSKTVKRTPGKPYTASNSFGAQVEVQPVHSSGIGIFLGIGSLLQDIFTGKQSYEVQTPLFSVNLSGDAARSLKENAAVLMVVVPQPPFFYQGSYYIEPKIDSPTEVFNTTDYVVADVQCVALADTKLGKVYQMRYLIRQN